MKFVFRVTVPKESRFFLMRLACLFVWFAILPTEASFSQENSVPRPAPPDAEEQAKIQEIVLRAFPPSDASDYKAIVASVTKILDLASKDTTSAGRRYVLLLEAQKRALAAGDADSFRSAITLRVERFSISKWKTCSTGYVAFAERAPGKFIDSQLVADSRELATEHADGGKLELEQSIEFLTAIWNAIKAANGDSELKASISALGSELYNRRSWEAQYERAVEVLAEDPENAAANFVVGQRLAIEGTDWPRALACFLKSGEKAFRDAARAEAEMEPPGAIADAWAEAVATVPRSSKLNDAITQHAIDWYERAKAGKTEELDRIAMQNSIDQLRKRLSTELDDQAGTLKPVAPSKKELLVSFGGTEKTQAAVSLSLAWLARNQKSNGAWSMRGPYGDGGLVENECAATAMALLAFIGEGQTHKQGVYKNVVRAGILYLLRLQNRSGFFADGATKQGKMYAQALATIAVCDLYRITDDPILKAPAELAIQFITMSQAPQGGWRYQPRIDSDTSVTGWFVTALTSGRNAGLAVEKSVWTKIDRYLETMSTDEKSAYRYHHNNPLPNPSMTAAGLLCRRYISWDRDQLALKRGIGELLKDAAFDYGDRDVYYWYYATRLLRHQGGSSWTKWNETMRVVLPANQVMEGPEKGSWSPGGDRWAESAGRLYTTCFSTYCLQAYYSVPTIAHDTSEKK